MYNAGIQHSKVKYNYKLLLVQKISSRGQQDWGSADRNVIKSNKASIMDYYYQQNKLTCVVISKGYSEC